MAAAIPKTGEIYMADLEPVRGSEQGRRRPVLVIQAPELARATSTFLCVPLTSNMARLGLPGTRGLTAEMAGCRRTRSHCAFISVRSTEAGSDGASAA